MNRTMNKPISDTSYETKTNENNETAINETAINETKTQEDYAQDVEVEDMSENPNRRPDQNIFITVDGTMPLSPPSSRPMSETPSKSNLSTFDTTEVFEYEYELNAIADWIEPDYIDPEWDELESKESKNDNYESKESKNDSVRMEDTELRENSEPLPQARWIKRWTYNNSAQVGDFIEEARQNPTTSGVRSALRRLLQKLRSMPRARLPTRQNLDNILGTIPRFGWAVRDPATGLRWATADIAITDLVRRERARLSRLPRGNAERINGLTTEGVNAFKYKARRALERVATIGRKSRSRQPEEIPVAQGRGGRGGDGDPDDPDDPDNIPDSDVQPYILPIGKAFILLVGLFSIFSGGAGLISIIKAIDTWLKGGEIETPKGRDPIIIKPPSKRPTKPPSKIPTQPPSKKPTRPPVRRPDKFMTIGHTEWFDSVGLSGIIDTYNSFVNAYNEATDNGSVTESDMSILQRKVTEYYNKFATVTNTPQLADLQEAKNRYDGLRKQYDDARDNGLDMNQIGTIYIELKQSMRYLDRMTEQFLKMEGGIFGTYKSKDDPDVTVDDADSNIKLTSVATMNKKGRGDKLKSPSDYILSKGMRERIARKLNREGLGTGLMDEQKLFDDFSLVTRHQYPEGIGIDNPLIVHNKRHEIMQYAKARRQNPPTKPVRYSKLTGQNVILNNVLQFDDVLDDAYYTKMDIELKNPYQTKTNNLQEFHKSKLYNPEYNLQKAFENRSSKNMATGGDMIRSGPYENVNKDQYYQLGNIQYKYNEKLNDYPMTRELPMGIIKKQPNQNIKIRKRVLPNSYSLK